MKEVFLKEHNEAKKNINIRNPLKSIPNSQSFLWLQSLGLWVHSRWENMVQAEEPKLISICFELPLFLLVVQPGACGCTQGAPADGGGA